MRYPPRLLLLATVLVPGEAVPRTVADAAPAEIARPLPPPGVPAITGAPRRATVVEQAGDGLFYVKAQINGASVDFVVDSGASVVVLSARDAARAGVKPAASVAVDTAGGSAAMHRARIGRVVLAGQTMSGVDAAIMGGDLEVSLLGQSALSQLGSVTFRGTRLELE